MTFMICRKNTISDVGHVVSVFGREQFITRHEAQIICDAFNRDTEHNEGWQYYVMQLGAIGRWQAKE